MKEPQSIYKPAAVVLLLEILKAFAFLIYYIIRSPYTLYIHLTREKSKDLT
jgi:hypothetical protein